MRRRAGIALVLVGVLALAGCDLKFSLGFGTGSDGTFEGSEVTVPVLYASGSKGGLTSQRITAASADGGDLSIDITENDVSGVDPVTQSATWTAVTAATLLTGARPDTAYTFGFDARLATPSAGAVTAVGVLALYYGTEVQPGVALAGGVTPLGIVSPVAGLPEQVSAAIEAGGIDTILVPAGQRVAADATGAPVDLDQLAATGGMTITEVADIAGAYAVMTGEDLPEAAFPTPAASPDALPSPRADADGLTDGALAGPTDDALTAAAAAVQGLDGDLADRVRAGVQRARELSAAGDTAGAFATTLSAADDAAAARGSALSAVEASAQASAVLADSDALLTALAGETPTTLDGADALLATTGATAEAWALASFARSIFAADADDAQLEAGRIAASLASASLARARTIDDVRASLGDAGPVAADADLDGLASLLRRAAIAADDAYDGGADETPAADDPAAVRLRALEEARETLSSRADESGEWVALAVASTSYDRSITPLLASQAVAVPQGVDPADAIAQRIAVGDEYVVRAVDALTGTGAEVPLVRAAAADAAARASATLAPGAFTAFTSPFLRARVLAFVGGVQRD
ncbi:hypothetical protein LPW41_12450 [Microbacterium sp. JC 701]|uniref:S16 family serine protease n=1 Tax=Microbacterium sp. JC 701 TaxID=2897389 RepID=UPI001E32BA60|nr:S16 family serine protease [Microbacterium sp. JC 701]MCD2170506.1 hypothetical protein [Microbacterium sp. JC 701]